MTICCSKGCTRKARLQLGWRAWPIHTVTTADGNSDPPVQAFSNQAVCFKHVPAKVPDYLPVLEIIRINAFLTERAHKPALDFDNAVVITKELPRGIKPMSTVMQPVHMKH